MLLVTACSTTAHRAKPAPNEGARIAHVAATLVGTPYHFGGADRQGFDCSGLAVYAHEQLGLQIPRTAAEQSRAALPVPFAQLEPGDLVFFHLHSRHIDHVGIYAGGGRFLHAPRRGEVVSYASLGDPYFRGRLAGAGRFWSLREARAAPRR
jgi:cell wall-associated NlpC family hydrolase